MSISEFIKVCETYFKIPLDEYEETCLFMRYYNDEKLSDDKDIIIYNSEYGFIDNISQMIAHKLYETDEFLQDTPPVNAANWEWAQYCSISSYFGMGLNYWVLPHITLSDIGIKKFIIKGCENPTIVYYSHMSDYERMIFDSFIYDVCAYKIIEYLSKLTCYKISKRKIDGLPGCIIVQEDKIAQINSLDQLKMYIYRYEIEKLNIFDTLLDCEIEIPSNLLNIKLEEFPRFVEVGIVLEEIWGNEYIDTTYIDDNIRFQVIINTDKNLVLKPFPLDLERIIKRQFNLWGNYMETYSNYRFIPSPLQKMATYLMKNKIKASFGYIERVLDYQESYEIATQIDDNAYNHCFIGNIQIFHLPEKEYLNYISKASRIIVQTLQI